VAGDLSIVKQFIDLHGAKISISSKENLGTEVRMEFNYRSVVDGDEQQIQ